MARFVHLLVLVSAYNALELAHALKQTKQLQLFQESSTTNYIILKGKLMCMQGPEDALKAVVKNLDFWDLTDGLVDSEVTPGECPGSKEKKQTADQYVVPTCLQGSICFGFKPDQLTLNAQDCEPLNVSCMTDALAKTGLANLRAAADDFAEAGLGNLSYIMPKDKSMCLQASNISYLQDVLGRLSEKADWVESTITKGLCSETGYVVPSPQMCFSGATVLRDFTPEHNAKADTMTMDFFKMLQEGSKGPCMQLQMDSTDVANQIEKLFDSLFPWPSEV